MRSVFYGDMNLLFVFACSIAVMNIACVTAKITMH